MITFTLPHWIATASWWLQAVMLAALCIEAVYRISGGSWKVEAPKGPGERAWFVIYYTTSITAFWILLVLARRAL